MREVMRERERERRERERDVFLDTLKECPLASVTAGLGFRV